MPLTGVRDPQEATAALGSNPCSIRRGRCSGSTRASRAAATARSRVGDGRRGRTAGRSRTASSAPPPTLPLPERLGRLAGRARGARSPSVAAGGGRGRAGAVPGERPHRDVGRAGERARARDRGPAGHPGRAVQPERGEARGRGVRRRPRRPRCRRWWSGCSASPSRRGSPDAADALALALCHLWGAPLRATRGDAGGRRRRRASRARSRPRWPRSGTRDDRLGARHRDRAQRDRRGAGRGRRRRLPVPGAARRGARRSRPARPAFLFTHLHVREDAMTLYGFPTRDERDTFEVLIGASGVGPKLALAMLSVHSPSALRRVPRRRRPRRAVPRARGGQAHRAEADGRAEDAPRRPRPRPRRARRRRRADRARRGAGRARPSSATGPRRSAPRSPTCPTTAPSATCSAPRSSASRCARERGGAGRAVGRR